MELKYSCCQQLGFHPIRSNRTFMELKSRNLHKTFRGTNSSNRTFMELK